VRPLGLGDGAFNSYVIYFSVIVPVLSLGVKVSIETSGDCKDCAISWVCGGGGGGGLSSFLIWGLLFCTG
jgi:hypothetical protein